MARSIRRLSCMVLGFLIAVMCMASWMLHATRKMPHEVYATDVISAPIEAVTSVSSSLKGSTVTTTVAMSTEQTSSTGKPKVTVEDKTHFYQELTNLFGVPLQDCSTYTFTERSCHRYKEMRFLNNSDEMYKQRVALASYPGSGNTWLRLILEDATGVFTGAVYNDRSLKCTGFIGEGKDDYNAVLVVKTHDPGAYDAVILLIRNPYHAIMSYRSFDVTLSHVTRAETQNLTIPSEKFGMYFRPWVGNWNAYVWNATAPYYIVEYEKLKTNFEETLIGVLKFLKFPINEEKLQCVVRNSYQQYHRPSVNISNPFSEEQKQQIAGWISEHAEELEKLSINYKAWVW